MKISLQRRHTLRVEDGAFSHKIDYVIFFGEVTGLRVTAILMNAWILPTSGAQRWRVCDKQGYFVWFKHDPP